MDLTSAQTTWAIIAIVAIVGVLLLIGFSRRAAARKQSNTLREKFGPEYERAVEESKSRKSAEQMLHERQERVESLHLRDLSASQREHYGQWWNQIQTIFVERPAIALAEAERLTTDLMRDRGYPAITPESQVEELSVRHGHLVQRIRHAQDVAQHDTSVEAMRDGMLDYRAVVAELLSVDLRSSQDRESR